MVIKQIGYDSELYVSVIQAQIRKSTQFRIYLFIYFQTVILTHKCPNIAYQTEEAALWWIATTFTVKRAENQILDSTFMRSWCKTVLLRRHLENVVILWYSR